MRSSAGGVSERGSRREVLAGLVEEEDAEEVFRAKVDEEVQFADEGVHGEEVLCLTVSSSVLPVHGDPALLRARLHARRTPLELRRELAGTLRRLA